MLQQEPLITEVEAKGKSIIESGKLNSFKDYYVGIVEHTIHYEMRKGKANPDRTIILAHGATATGDTTKVTAKGLADAYPNARIIIVDLPYHGDSTGPKEKLKDVTIHTYVDVMSDFIEKLKEDGVIKGKLNWTGWSMGGSIGMLLDLKGVEIDELTLLTSSPVWHVIQAQLNSMPPEMTGEMFAPIHKQMLGENLKPNMSEKDHASLMSEYDVLHADPDVMLQDFHAIIPSVYDIQDRLGEIDAKTLIIGGIHDTVALPEYQTMMDERIKSSKLVMLDDNHEALMKPNSVQNIVAAFQGYFGK